MEGLRQILRRGGLKGPWEKGGTLQDGTVKPPMMKNDCIYWRRMLI